MSKQVYISADYSKVNGDHEIVKILNEWCEKKQYKVNFIDMSRKKTGSISTESDCFPCDLKQEFNQQINASSAVVFVVGDKTRSRTAGNICARATSDQIFCSCTPYKQNTNGTKTCKNFLRIPSGSNNVDNINTHSYLQHEFEQAKKRGKNIVVVYNSLRKESSWLPSYMKGYETNAHPFWMKNAYGEKVGDYAHIKQALGYV